MQTKQPHPNRRWIRRPDGSNWGDFGDDDELGCLNYIGPAERRYAASLVQTGETFCLSLPLDYPGGRVLAPHRSPPCVSSVVRNGRPYFNYRLDQEVGGATEVGCDDVVTLSTQYSTQWDSFAHMGYLFDADGDGEVEMRYYNGFEGGVDIVPPELREQGPGMPLGIDTFATKPIQGRGVLVDLDRHLGRGSREIDYAALDAILRMDEVSIRPGDLLCVHTGYADEILKMQGDPDPHRARTMCAALDGRDERLLNWVTESKIAAIAADNFAVERVAPLVSSNSLLPLHRHCLFKRGIALGELWYLTELAGWLATHGRTDFLLTAPPLRLRGAVGSPVTPVATV